MPEPQKFRLPRGKRNKHEWAWPVEVIDVFCPSSGCDKCEPNELRKLTVKDANGRLWTCWRRANNPEPKVSK